MKKMWCPARNDATVSNNNNNNEGGKTGRVSATSGFSVLLQEDLGATSTSEMQRDTDVMVDTPNGSVQVAGKLGWDGPGDVTSPPSLLAQPHIRTLLVMDGLFSVRTFVLWSNRVSRFEFSVREVEGGWVLQSLGRNSLGS